MILETIDSLSNDFKNYLQAANSNINAFAPDSFWDIFAGANAGILLDLYASLQLVRNSIFPQNSVGDQVDIWLYIKGLPARGLPTYGQITVHLSTGSATIAAGTQFTSIDTGNIYQTFVELTISNDTDEFILYALETGNTYAESAGNTLTGDSVSVVVVNSIVGANLESDQSCINRILTAARAPIAGARATDYQIYCLQYNSTLVTPVITDSIVIPSFTIENGVNILGIFPLIGSSVTDYLLDQGLLPATTFVEFSRQIDTGTLDGVTNYIQSLRLVGLTARVGKCVTQIIAPITINVSLAIGYSNTSTIEVQSQDSNGNPIIIELTTIQLIQRELRRAINNQPFGGTLINGTNYITLDSLSYALNSQLGVKVGQLAQILINLDIAGSDIVVNSASFSDTEITYIYDISLGGGGGYSNITVNIV